MGTTGRHELKFIFSHFTRLFWFWGSRFLGTAAWAELGWIWHRKFDYRAVSAKKIHLTHQYNTSTLTCFLKKQINNDDRIRLWFKNKIGWWMILVIMIWLSAREANKPTHVKTIWSLSYSVLVCAASCTLVDVHWHILKPAGRFHSHTLVRANEKHYWFSLPPAFWSAHGRRTIWKWRMCWVSLKIQWV